MSQGLSEAEGAKKAVSLSDRLTLFIVLGCVIGARLGHVFFYDWSIYSHHPIEILKVWKGGLASHGAAVGIVIAIFLFLLTSKKEKPYLSFFVLLDALVIPAAFAGGCIRIGNFINQEVLGIPTALPWGVVFRHPIQRIPPDTALHPVQIYESVAYFLIALFLFYLWKKRQKILGEGLLSGLFFLLIFGFRFIVEFLKLPQSDLFKEGDFLTMGQLLSIPFVFVGIALLIHYFRKKQ